MAKKGYKNYIEKPWGYELIVSKELTSSRAIPKQELFTVHKILVVLPDQSLSYQYHKLRREIWHIKSGFCELTIDGKTYTPVVPGTVWIIDPLVKHSITAVQVTVIDEVSENYLDSDIIRISDKYGRVK